MILHNVPAYPVWTDERAEMLREAAERQAEEGRDMFAQVAEGLHAVGSHALAPLADDFAHLLNSVEA